MMLIPEDTPGKLEFDKILELLRDSCLGELGRKAAISLRPDTDIRKIRQKLEEVHEFEQAKEAEKPFPFRAYEDIGEDLKHLEVEGYVLPLEALVRIQVQLRLIADLNAFFTAVHKEEFPRLYAVVGQAEWESSLIEAIDKVLDEEGEIRPDASPELSRIRRGIQAKRGELDRVFRQLIQGFRQRDWLTDNVESFRNGRRVLSVPAEHKRKIRGIIHDESSTGKTAFIEPEGVIEINNDIFDLEQAEKREIYRILRELSAILRPWVPAMRQFQDILVHFDLIQAKGYLARRMEASMPELEDVPRFGIKRGFHPILLLKNRLSGKPTIPFDLELHPPNRMVVLSGPNAGGKSITLKSVGLLQLMVQSGLLIPADPESEMGIFHNIFADIGDQQSIEDDLSTYSSHLRNMRRFVEQADQKTLVLIDEFGAGTDPQMGGAIAEAILRRLNEKGSWGLITTHYSNLKIFAYKTKGIVNASMTFDKDSLSPTYQFSVGRPGSSYAYEIAQQSGLEKKVLAHARDRIGKSEQAVDQLLIDLQREKQEIEDKLTALKEREGKLEQLIKNYESLHRDLEFRRKKLKLEAKEKALQETARENKTFEKVIREIREEKNIEKAKEMAAEVRQEREKLSRQVGHLREEVFYKPDAREISEQEIQVGDYVRLRSGGATGTVESLDKSRAVVQVGQMRVTAKLRDLKRVSEPLDIQSSRSVRTDTAADVATFNPDIDIRGMRMEEALKAVEEFVDQALVAAARHLRIVHGKGNGILRQAVRRKLGEYDIEMDVRHPDAREGGDGVTLVDLG